MPLFHFGKSFQGHRVDRTKILNLSAHRLNQTRQFVFTPLRGLHGIQNIRIAVELQGPALPECFDFHLNGQHQLLALAEQLVVHFPLTVQLPYMFLQAVLFPPGTKKVRLGLVHGLLGPGFLQQERRATIIALLQFQRKPGMLFLQFLHGDLRLFQSVL